MPVGSEPPALPHTWRPLGTRMVGLVGGIGLVALITGGWIGLGPSLRATFTPWQRITLLALGGLAAVVWWALLRPRLVATDDGLIVVNGYKRRDLVWAQVVAIRLRRGAPWAEMDLADGTSIPVMALQGSDGDRALDAVRAVRALVAARSEASGG